MFHDILNATYLDQVKNLKEIVAYYVSKECFNVNDLKKTKSKYEILRNSLVQNASIRERLPKFIISCRTLREAGDYIRLFEKQDDYYSQNSTHITNEFQSILNWLEFGLDPIENIPSYDKFKVQFPAGLPFGKEKPKFYVTPFGESQLATFQEESSIGVIRQDVYPNFTYQGLEKSLSGTQIKNSNLTLKQTLINMCSGLERKFLDLYASTYNMEAEAVPVLIPQAWIQWHSITKKDLHSLNSSYADDLQRVDFVAFWNHQRFAIHIDGIEHYAKKHYPSKDKYVYYWKASEEEYSKQLQQDRKLLKAGWKVFRVSNWEIHNKQLHEILEDLRGFMEF